MTARILVVDDDLAVRTAVVEALDNGSMDITVAASGEEAVRSLHSGDPPDIVLSDIRMGGVDGLDVLRIVREKSPGSSVVMMTAYHDVATAVTAMREGAADFLCKPFDLQSLRSVITRLLPGAPEPGRAALERDGGARSQADPAAGGASVAATTSAGTAAPFDGPIELVGRYRLEHEIGRGAMATVYRARDARHDRHVAVKLMRPEVAASIGTARFLQEIQIAARLHHPHILTLIDSGERDGVPFFVMPLVDGASLRRFIETEAPVDGPRAAALLQHIADALAAAHELGVVHRDVKPENVLLSGRNAWVADFGVARAIRDAAGVRQTSIGSAIGTPAYMAPEQVTGLAETDHRADIYALGAVAYELLSGRPPFFEGGARGILAAHLVSSPTPLGDGDSSIPPGMEEAVMRCLAKKPEDRWPDAGALAETFAGFALERQ